MAIWHLEHSAASAIVLLWLVAGTVMAQSPPFDMNTAMRATATIPGRDHPSILFPRGNDSTMVSVQITGTQAGIAQVKAKIGNRLYEFSSTLAWASLNVNEMSAIQDMGVNVTRFMQRKVLLSYIEGNHSRGHSLTVILC